jgi:ABC-type Fe3+-hydroxamate transport system substrate-binding protein
MSLPLQDWVDAVGTHHPPVSGPARIVCLVPSITELLFDLGLGDQVVGRTHYCVHPADQVATVTDLGGTKKIKQRLLRELRPTHVIVNVDENPRAMVEQIAGYGPRIIVTHPLAPEDNLDLYRLLGGIFRRQDVAEALCDHFQQALTALREAARDWPTQQVLYLIWRKPWMTVARDTYIARTLALVNWQTWPATATARYPAVELDSGHLREIDRVLFSSEPYRFQPADLAAFATRYDYPAEQVRLIDGEMTSWYGSRAIRGLEYLRRFAEPGD